MLSIANNQREAEMVQCYWVDIYSYVCMCHIAFVSLRYYSMGYCATQIYSPRDSPTVSYVLLPLTGYSKHITHTSGIVGIVTLLGW